MTIHCRLLILITFACLVLLPHSSTAGQSGAKAVITGFNAALLESMKRADELCFTGRYKLLEPVIKNSFALSFMAEKSVGRYWKTLQEKQQRLLLETYTGWSIARYAKNFDGYSGEKFEGFTETGTVRGTVTVISRLIVPDDETIDFYYKLRKITNDWQIVDIQIEGVSQLALTRTQCMSVIKNKGFDALISSLQKKIKVLSQEEKK
jgi:phospholipid transport system substrate-binding protein